MGILAGTSASDVEQATTTQRTVSLSRTQEERIANEFGELYTARGITEAYDAWVAAVGTNRTNFENTQQYRLARIPSNRGDWPAMHKKGEVRDLEEVDIALRRSFAELGVPFPQNRGGSTLNGLYRVGLVGYVFWNLDDTLRTTLVRGGVPALTPMQRTQALVPLYNAADIPSNVPTVEQVRQLIYEKFNTIIDDLNISDLGTDNQEASIYLNRVSLALKESARGWFGGGANNDTIGIKESEVTSLLVRNFVWGYYLTFVEPGPGATGAHILASTRLDALYGQCGLRPAVALLSQIRIRQYILEADNVIIAEEARDPSVDGIAEEGAHYEDAARARVQSEIERRAAGQDGESQNSAEEIAQLKRLAEQAFLADNLPELAMLNQTERTPLYANERGTTFFTMVQGHTDTIVNKLLFNDQLRHLEKLLPAEISALVPQIRLYKIFYEVGENGERGDPYEQEVPFEAYMSAESITAMTTPGIARGRGAGLVSFDWKLEGQNPFTARRDIYAGLKLFFQSLDDFLRIMSLPVAGRPGTRQDFRYVDLVNIGLREHTSNAVWNPDYYKLKVDVGWAPADADVFLGSAQEKELKRKAVENARMAMYLTAYEHEMSINEFGNVNLEVSYIAWQEGSYYDSDSDVLADENVISARLERRSALQNAGEACNEDYIAQLTRDYQQQIRTEKYNSWQRIIKELYQHDQIFFLSVPVLELDSYINYGATNQPDLQGFRNIMRNQSSASPAVNVDFANPAPGNSDEALADRVGGREPPGEDETLLSRLQELTYDDTNPNVNVQFFYFGDLVEVALRNISENQENAGSAAGGSTIGKLDKKLRFILGPISYRKLIRTGGSTPSTTQGIQALAAGEAPTVEEPEVESQIVYNINIADIPISVNYFIEWFMDQSISRERTIYPFLNFIRDLANKLLTSILSEQAQSFRNITRQNLQLRTNFFSAKAHTDENGQSVDILSSRRNILPQGNQNTRINLDAVFDDQRNLPGPLLERPREGEEAYHYMLMYAINTERTQALVGNIAEDTEKGIYHLSIGKDRGMFKSVNFTKTDIPGLRESRFESDVVSSATGLAILANVYDIEVKMFGNTNFYPGMKLYLDPHGLGGNLGRPSSPSSAAYKLGIGGYHSVYRVESFIEAGKYETTIKAIFEGTGQRSALGFNTPNETDNPAEGCAASERAIDLLFGTSERSDT